MNKLDAITFKKKFRRENDEKVVTVTIRFDDECNNGHNSLGITASVYEKNCPGGGSFGCCHEDVVELFPELEKYIKWHLTSSDGPMYYVENTMYHADEHGPKYAHLYQKDVFGDSHCIKYGDIEEMQKIVDENEGYYLVIDTKTAKTADLEAARSCAIWPDATLEQLQDRKVLEARLPGLMKEFENDIMELKEMEL